MSSILRVRKCALLIAAVLIGGVCVSAGRAHAADSMSVTVTPPLFQLAIGPGESWSSSIKVVNNNDREVTYYARVMDFEAKGEDGTSTFVPLVDDGTDPSKDPFSLARWVRLPQMSVTVPAGQSGELPFSVIVPENAEPGGHYAAVLIGTQPVGTSVAGALVNVSSFVSSLLMVRIKGEVIERGRIREFITGANLYQEPVVDFGLRFENQGNSHLKPAGDIVIYNMWGKERGRVALNQENGNFGNVLPDSIRKFEFTWVGESEPFDIGLYSAVATLAFGDEAKQNVTAKTYFWVVPVVPVSLTLLVLLGFIALVTWLIRRYIRRALELERMYTGTPVPDLPQTIAPPPKHTVAVFMEPLREGVIDLRSVASGHAPHATTVSNTEASTFVQLTILAFLSKYRLFILFLATVSCGVLVLFHYLDRTLVPERKFQITDVTIREEPLVPVDVGAPAR